MLIGLLIVDRLLIKPGRTKESLMGPQIAVNKICRPCKTCLSLPEMAQPATTIEDYAF
jgi:hypothetical protein